MARRLCIAFSGLLAGCTFLLTYPEPSEEVCGNGVDDDGDGLTDCFEEVCFMSPACLEERGVTCMDGRDNDSDGLVDHADVQCWSTAQTTLDRCAAVGGETVVLGAEPGLDWNLDPDFPAASVVVNGSPALTAEWGASDVGASITNVPLGAVDGTTITIHTVLILPVNDETVPGSLEVTLGGSRAIVQARLRVDWSGNWVSLGAEGLATELEVGWIFEAGVWVPCDLSFVFDATTVTVTAQMDGVTSQPMILPIPPGWATDEPLPIAWHAYDGNGVTGAEIARPLASRCGSQQPFPELDGFRVLAAAWSESGEICTSIFRPDLDAAVLLRGQTPVDESLPAFEVEPPVGLRVVALAYDAEAATLRALGQQLAWYSPPVLMEAPGCGGPWNIVGPAFPEEVWGRTAWPGNIRAMRLDGPRGDELLVVPHDGIGPMQIAYGDVTVPNSFVIDPTSHGSVGTDERVGGAVAGDHFIALRLGTERELWISTDSNAEDCSSGSCVVFGATDEPTTFDRDGFPPRGTGIRWPFANFAMEPSPAPGEPWRGLLFYEGCVGADCRLGATWLRIAPP